MSIGYALVLCSVSPFGITLLLNWISEKQGDGDSTQELSKWKLIAMN
jgi:hypothetical protein